MPDQDGADEPTAPLPVAAAGLPDRATPDAGAPDGDIPDGAAPDEPTVDNGILAGGTPDEPGRRSSPGATVLVAALVSLLVVVLCGGGIAALYLIGTKDRQPAAAASASASASPTPQVQPTTAAPSPTFDPGSIIRGNCLVNNGTDAAPSLRVVPCGPGTYVVLVRIDSTSDTNKCRTVPGTTHHYFYSTTPATLDFVLCLKKQ